MLVSRELDLMYEKMDVELQCEECLYLDSIFTGGFEKFLDRDTDRYMKVPEEIILFDHVYYRRGYVSRGSSGYIFQFIQKVHADFIQRRREAHSMRDLPPPKDSQLPPEARPIVLKVVDREECREKTNIQYLKRNDLQFEGLISSELHNNGESIDNYYYVIMPQCLPLDRYAAFGHTKRDVVRQVADALLELRARDLYYCDLKFANIMISTAGKIKLVDIGSIVIGLGRTGSSSFPPIRKHKEGLVVADDQTLLWTFLVFVVDFVFDVEIMPLHFATSEEEKIAYYIDVLLKHDRLGPYLISPVDTLENSIERLIDLI